MPSTDAGESTAQPSEPIAEHKGDVLKLKFPRCCVCEVGWYSYDADDEDKKPSGFSSHHTEKTRPSHTKLYPLPPCQCEIKMAALNKEVYSMISNDNYYLHKSPHDVLSNIHVQVLNQQGICKPCLEKKIETSNEVLIKDYQQNDVPNGQPDVKFSIKLQCYLCSQKFTQRKMTLEKLYEQGNELIRNSGKKKTIKKDMSWFDYVENTIKLVGWMKRQERRARREARRSRSGEDKKTTANWWTEHERSNYEECSSDDCYSFSSDSEVDYDKKPAAQRQIAQAGEVKKYFEHEQQKFRKQVEEQVHQDEELARKLTEELGSQEALEEIKQREEQSQADYKLAQEWEEREKKETNRGNQKRKSEKQHIKSFFAKQLKTDPINPSAVCSNLAERGSPPEERSFPAAAAAAATASQDTTCPNLSILIEMGYQRDVAEECLADAKQDINLAVSMLLDGYEKKTEEGDNVIDLSVDG